MSNDVKKKPARAMGWTVLSPARENPKREAEVLIQIHQGFSTISRWHHLSSVDNDVGPECLMTKQSALFKLGLCPKDLGAELVEAFVEGGRIYISKPLDVEESTKTQASDLVIALSGAETDAEARDIAADALQRSRDIGVQNALQEMADVFSKSAAAVTYAESSRKDWVHGATPPTGVRRMVPSVGRIVHYTNLGDKEGKFPPEVQAAIVTGVVEKDVVSLHIFYKTGQFDMPLVEYTTAAAGSDEARGKWTWPARSES